MQISIAKRLALLILAAIASLVIITVVSYRQLDQVFVAANFNSVNVVPSLVLLNRGAIEVGRYRVRVFRHAIATNDQNMVKAEAQIQEIRITLERTLREYEPLIHDAEDKRLLEATRSALSIYSAHVDQTLALSRAHKQQETFESIDKLTPVATSLMDAITAHMQYNESLGKAESAKAATAKEHANTIAVLVTLIALIALSLLGLSIIRSLTRRIQDACHMAERIAGGHLAPAGISNGNDEIGKLLQSLDKMRADLASTIRDIANQAESVGTAATHVSSAAGQVATSSQNQSQSTAAAAAAVEELTVSIDHVGTSADDARLQANDAEDKAISSGKDVDAATDLVTDVAHRVDQTAEQISTLAERVQKIGNVTTVIREVADQTNLLALNAAIEAARAGEQGRGFAVVADEVRKLAERTTQSVQEISSMISAIQSEAITAVNSMQGSREVVNNVVTSASRASMSMQEIRSSAETVQSAITGISDALREQRSASLELSRNVEAIAQMSEENSAAIATVSSTANQLETISIQLKSSVAKFSF